MRDINKIILLGRIGADAIMRKTQNGRSVLNFSLATARWSKNGKNGAARSKKDPSLMHSENEASSEWEADTQWHRIVVWGRLAERYEGKLKKGASTFVEGLSLIHI